MKKKIKIAIVEDDIFFNRTLKKYIETICNPSIYTDMEFEINTFQTADSAIQQLEDDLDLMVLDYHLYDPESDENLNGEDVLAAVNKHCPNCKVILLSGNTGPEKVFRMKMNGIHEFVDKNLSSKNRLGAIIQRTIKNDMRA